ncbi:hypothetical protein T05_3344 [Trichinella murrelli]|uniref:Uncharacterized protein n=1 Tax=Trichinella murrelli TaxID=144512 RepID=A0A0V0U0U8_9BILA|nr:hypothetical protein T05_3344 [Trichinella murrelli]
MISLQFRTIGAIHSIKRNVKCNCLLRKLNRILDPDSEIQLSYRSKSTGYAWGYASGKIPKISNFLKYSPRLCPQATPQGK